MNFTKSSQLVLEDVQRFSNPLSFGNNFLDDSLGGIFPNDLIIITAKTGGGKTELATNIAYENAKLGKRVHFFALEADHGEIERRLKFKKLAQAFYIDQSRRHDVVPNYQDWLLKGQDFLDPFTKEVEDELAKELETMTTFYRDNAFTPDDFSGLLHQIGRDSDLIVLDHLHYFDFEDENENQAMKRTVKEIRKLQAFYKIPIILVCHVRKTDKRSAGLLPEIDDIHGSSDISKIATRIVAASPARDVQRSQENILPTYFRVLKNRFDGPRTWYIGLVGFNLSKNQYEPTYKVGEIDYANTEVTLLDQFAAPSWSQKTNKRIL